MLLAQGGFSTAQLEQKLVGSGAQRMAYKKYTLFTRGNDSVAFPGHGVAVAGQTPMVQNELDLLADRLARFLPN